MEMLIGFVIIFLMAIFDRKMLRIEFDKIAKFCGFLAIFVAFQICVGSFAAQGLPQEPHPQAFLIPAWQIGLVPWEDAFYAVPLYYYGEWLGDNRSKWALYSYIAFAVGLSVWFGLGHAYQGVMAIFVTALYPTQFSLRFGRAWGFGTVMACHILYDLAITALQRFGHLMY